MAAAALERILEDALSLPDDSKLALAERLVESVSAHVPPEIEGRQIAEVRRRIAEVQGGRVELVPGEFALNEVREALQRVK